MTNRFLVPWFLILALDCWITGTLYSLNILRYFLLFKPILCVIILKLVFIHMKLKRVTAGHSFIRVFI